MDCRFCSYPAIARFAMDRGCVCYPADREQALCAQHIVRATPLGKMELTEVLDPETWEWLNQGFSGTMPGW